MRARGAAAAAFLFSTSSATAAFGYSLNAHVAICQHALDSIESAVSAAPPGQASIAVAFSNAGRPDLTSDKATAIRLVPGSPSLRSTLDKPSFEVRQGEPAGAAGEVRFTIPRATAELLLANKAYFRGGCGAPDALPFFGNTDPSHAYGWDPVGIYYKLIDVAKSPEEKAWALGWGAHLMTDAAVHAFANTHAALAEQQCKSASEKSTACEGRHDHLDRSLRRIEAGALRLLEAPAPAPAALRPLTWDTWTPPNALGHIASEMWINRYFIYAEEPESLAIATPEALARAMFLSPKSPIFGHYARILKVWKKSGEKLPSDDIVRNVASDTPGSLATVFQKSLEELHNLRGIHASARRRIAEKLEKHPSDTHPIRHLYFFLLDDFHARRLAKIDAILSAWLTSTLDLQRALTARRYEHDALRSAVAPFGAALAAFVQLDLINVRSLCAIDPATGKTPLEALTKKHGPLIKLTCKNAVELQTFIDEHVEQIKAHLKDLILDFFQPLLVPLERFIMTVAGVEFDKLMSREARDQARALLGKANLLKDPAAGEPDPVTGRLPPPATGSGVDGPSGPENKKKLLAYPLYRNAVMATLAAIEDRKNIEGLPSADFTNGIRCTHFFRTKEQNNRPFAIVMNGDPESLYSATTEICHTPNLTSLSPARPLIKARPRPLDAAAQRASEEAAAKKEAQDAALEEAAVELQAPLRDSLPGLEE